MKNFIAQNKKLLCAIGCGLLAAIILVVVFTACVDDDKNVTEPTGVASEATGGIVTTPSNVTEPDVTEPGDITEPTTPDVTEPQKPEKPAAPRDPNAPFGGATPGNLTAEEWKSWDAEQRQEFCKSFDVTNLSLDDKYNFYSIIQFGGLYDCGHKGHYCPNAECHDYVMTLVAEGCPHCGGNDCAAFYARDELGFTEVNYDQCPQYDITKDPVEYCQECGLKSGKGGCIQLISGGNCPHCGEKIPAMTCHHCDD